MWHVQPSFSVLHFLSAIHIYIRYLLKTSLITSFDRPTIHGYSASSELQKHKGFIIYRKRFKKVCSVRYPILSYIFSLSFFSLNFYLQGRYLNSYSLYNILSGPYYLSPPSNLRFLSVFSIDFELQSLQLSLHTIRLEPAAEFGLRSSVLDSDSITIDRSGSEAQ